MSELVRIITSTDPAMRNRSLDAFCRAASLADLLAECAALERFRRASDNLYERVRALFFLYAIHRFHLPLKPGARSTGFIPFDGLRQSAAAAVSRRPSTSSWRRRRRRGRAPRSPARWPRPTTGWASRRWPTRCGAACARCAATSGCSASATRPTTRCGAAGTAAAQRRRALPDPARDDAGAHGPLAQRLERHLLPGHGLSRRARACSTSPSTWRVRGPASGAPQPPVEAYLRVIDEPVLRLASVDLGERRHRHRWPRCSTSPATTWGC